MFEILQYICGYSSNKRAKEKKVTKINTSALTETCDELSFGNS